MSNQIYTLRHGKSAAKPGTFDAWDPPLVDVGYEQALRAGAFAAAHLSISLVIASPTLRTVQTTAAVKKSLTNVPVIYDERVKEQFWNVPGGINKNDIFGTEEMQARAKAEGLGLRINPGAESEIDVAERMFALTAEYADYSGNILLITHGTPSKVLPAVANDVDRPTYLKCKPATGSIALLDIHDPNIRTPLFP